MQINRSAIKSLAKLVLIAMLLMPIPWPNAHAAGKLEELQRKMADITLLKGQLGERMQHAEAAMEALLKQQNDLLAEVHVLMKSLKIKSYQDAQESLRMRNDMQLLGILAAFRQAFETKIRTYQTGRDKLTYLQQLVDDDTKMISTLSDFHIDALTTQISLVINQYLDEAHTVQIDFDKIEAKSPQSTWEAIVGGKY